MTTPGEGMFTYDEGTPVDLLGEAEEGYRFIMWTGDVDTIANANAVETNITVNGDCCVAISPIGRALALLSLLHIFDFGNGSYVEAL